MCLLVSLPFKLRAVVFDCRTFTNFLFLSVQWISNRFQDNLWAFSSVPTDSLHHPSASQIFPRTRKSSIFNEYNHSNAFSLEWMGWVNTLNKKTIHSHKRRFYNEIPAMDLASEIHWSIVLCFMKCLVNTSYVSVKKMCVWVAHWNAPFCAKLHISLAGWFDTRWGLALSHAVSLHHSLTLQFIDCSIWWILCQWIQEGIQSQGRQLLISSWPLITHCNLSLLWKNDTCLHIETQKPKMKTFHKKSHKFSLLITWQSLLDA